MALRKAARKKPFLLTPLALGSAARHPAGLTVLIIEDSDGQHTLQVVQLNVLPLPPCPPKLQGRLGYEVPTCVAGFARDQD